MSAADEAASEAASDDRKAALASRRLILDAINEAHRSLSEQIKGVEGAVLEVGDKVETGFEDLGSKMEELSESSATATLEPKLDAIVDRLTEQAERPALDPEAFKEAIREQVEDLKDAVVTEVRDVVRTDVRTLFEEFIGRPSASRTALDFTTSQPIQEHLDQLRADDPEGASYIEELIQNGAQALVRAIRTQQLARRSIPVLVAAGRIAGSEGGYAEAEQAYLWAVELAKDDSEKARHYVRAAGAAYAQDDEERFRRHLDAARARDDSLASLAIAEARTSDDPQFMLTRIEGVVPSTDDERALLHQTRAQAYLTLGEEQLAREEFEAARAANASNISVREFEAILPWFAAQLAIARGVRPEREPLVEAAKRFIELADEVAGQGRANEAVQVRARAAEAYMLAGDTAAATEVLDGLPSADLLSDRARMAVARSAMVCQRPELVLRYAPEDGDAEARLVRAEAQAIGGDHADRVAAVPVLEDLLTEEEPTTRRQAAFALLAGSAADIDIAWNDEAAEVVREVKPETEAAMRAERLATEGDLEQAEATLLPYAGRVQSLKRLRDYAAMRGDWQKVEDRCRALLRLDDDPFDRIALADALHRTGQPEEATAELRALTGKTGLSKEVREAAFGALMGVVGGDRHYERIRDLAKEWRAALPESHNAIWNLAFALARLSQHAEAYTLLKGMELPALNEQRATLFGEILLRGAPAEEAVRGIIALSNRFERSLEPLEAMTIAASLRAEQEGVQLPDELGERIGDTFASFEERFPDSTTIRTFRAPETPEEFQELFSDLQGDRPQRQREAMEAVRDGRAAVNLLAALSNGSVGATWGRLLALPLGFAIDETEVAEREVAAGGIGGAAVWDSSSIFIVGIVPEAAKNAMSVALPGSLIATETLEDVDRDALLVGRGVAETFHDEEGNVGIREIPDKEREEESRRIREALELARTFNVEPAPGPGGHQELARLYEDGREGAIELQALVASTLLAHRTGRPLYSDDRWVREAARSLGIPTFGTLALLDAMDAAGLLSSPERHAARAALAARGAWGVGLGRDELIAAGRSAEFELDRTLAGAFRDRATWRGRPGEMWRAINAFLAVVFDEKPEAFASWIHRALDASAAALPSMPKSWSVEVMLMMAWDEGPDAPVLSKKCFYALVKEAQSLPLHLSTLGHDPVLAATAQFMSFIADQPEDIRFAYFTRVLRDLPAPEQFRLVMTFLGNR